jgi:triacylglycerol esterase/lipase EstA (alpha/beta hydrolase family)
MRASKLYRFTWYDLEKGTFKDDSEGIKVDYGGIFPDKHGYEQHTEKRKLPIIFTQDREMKTRKPWVWSGNTPVHFICHSQGGNTVRYLLHLMEHGSRGLIDGTLSDIPAHLTYFDKPGRSKWAISVSTIGTPHRGTTIFDALQNYFRVCCPPILFDFSNVSRYRQLKEESS